MSLYDGDGNICCCVVKPMCEEPPVVMVLLRCASCELGSPSPMCAHHYRFFATGIPCTHCGVPLFLSEPVSL